jgi:hypothetical protein
VLVGVIKPGDKQALQMDLQRTPPEGSVNIFACWDHPNPDLAVGRAICVDDQHVIELKAANVQFVCRTNHEYGVVPAQTALELGSCSQYKVYAYQFEPAIALELAAAK